VRVVVFLFFGLVVGAVMSLVAPGRGPRSWVESLVIGASGAMVGGVFASAFGWNTDKDRGSYVVALLGAAAWVAIYRVVLRRYPAH